MITAIEGAAGTLEFTDNGVISLRQGGITNYFGVATDEALYAIIRCCLAVLEIRRDKAKAEG